MRKLRNTLYITKEDSFLRLDGENVVLLLEGKEIGRLPFTNLENIVCMNYVGCSPALMGKCASESIGLSFVTPSGKFLARVTGPVKGNVLLRKAQLDLLRRKEICIPLVQEQIAGKLKNTRFLLKRSLRDHPELPGKDRVEQCVSKIEKIIERLPGEKNLDTLRGMEGQGAKAFYFVFDDLLTQQQDTFRLSGRTKRPPLDPSNAMLSFLYTLCTNEIASSLEVVGLDPYIGFFHTLRPGRVSLACDIVEEFRSYLERLVISQINLKAIKPEDFEFQVSGAVMLNEEGRRKILSIWQTKKKEELVHPILKEKIPFGLFFYVQSMFFAQYLRGELEHYPPLVWR